jgi:hypothetical protein
MKIILLVFIADWLFLISVFLVISGSELLPDWTARKPKD